MFPWLLQHVWMIAILALTLGVLSLILGLTAWVRANALARRLKRWRAIHGSADLEEVYAQTLDEVGRLKGRIETLNTAMEHMQQRLQSKVNTVSILRYNAFANMGSDLSFSLAMLDAQGDGAVVSSIYGREETRTYAKPIVQGHSQYALTEEEQRVIAASIASAHNPSNLIHHSQSM